MKIERYIANQDYILITGIGCQHSFEAPKDAADSRRIAETVSRMPSEQREIADRLNKLFGFVKTEAPNPVPEEGGQG